MRLLICLLTCSILILPSCTIEKRAFRKGYYISWNRSLPREKSSSKEEAKESEPLARESISKDTTQLKVPEPAQEPCLAESLEKTDTTQLAEQTPEPVAEKTRMTQVYSEEALFERLSRAVESVKEQVKESRQTEEEEAPKRKVNLFALNAFVLAIGYVILAFVAFEGSGSGVNFAIMGIVVCLFTAIAFAVIGLVKWRRNRSGFWGTFFALLALIVLVTGSLVFFVYAMSNSSFG
ncbi:hypothetical protein [Fluviicola sp.]|uniref:hypothetical protein n=1 Tax=Fluviicola sp. TaxID=1917219 RepID=UPI0031DAA15F